MSKSSLAWIFLLALSVTACSGADAPADDEELAAEGEAILGGTQAPEKVAPASVLLLNKDGKQVCGGTLIARRWVLTAAHCWYKFEEGGRDLDPPIVDKITDVLLGSKDSQAPAEWATVASHHEHPGYILAVDSPDDIALLELEQNSRFEPARLFNGADAQPAVNTELITVGWGAIDNAQHTPQFQQMVSLPLLSTATCTGAFPTLTANQFCAGGKPNQDVCHGDSGSPIYAKVGSEYRVLGLTMYSKGLCGDGPSVFTRVGAYTDWINSVTNDVSKIWFWPATTAWPPTGTPVNPGDPADNRVPTSGSFTRPAIYQALSGDFNGDGKADVFHYQPGSGKDYLYITGEAVPRQFTVTADYEPLVGDFDGNGRSDIFWYAPGTAQDKLWWFDGNASVVSVNVTQNGVFSRPFAAKLDNNARWDIYWYEPGATADGIWYITGRAAVTNQPTFTTTAKEVPGTFIPLPGNYNGDTFGDIFWYAPGTAQDLLWKGTATQGVFTAVNQTVNGANYKPFAGDFDGNGRSDIYWYQPGDGWDGIWWFNGDAAHVQVEEKMPTYATPVIGDFSGTVSGQARTDDIFWYRGGRARAERW